MRPFPFSVLLYQLALCLFAMSLSACGQNTSRDQVQAASTDPAVPFTIEVAEFSYPFLSDAEQTTLLAELLQEVTIRADYLPKQVIEGKTQKTSRSFQLFSGLVGIGPIPDPHIETKVEVFEKHLETKARWERDPSSGHYLLKFNLPAQLGELFPLASLTMNIPNASFWNHKGINALPLKRDYGDLTLVLIPAAEQSADHFRLSELSLPMPANEISRSGVFTIKGSWTQNGSTHFLQPQMEFNQDTISGKLHQDTITLGSHEQAQIKAGKIPDLIKSLQFPGWFFMNTSSLNDRILPMPANAPRWHGLNSYHGKGTQIGFSEVAGFQFLKLNAYGPIEAGTERGPSKTESWTGFQGKLVSYRGEYNYYDDNSTLPDLSWSIRFLDGKRVGSGMVLTAQKDGEYKKLASCPQPECQRNVAEVQAQIAKRDAELQKEFELYLRLYQQAAPIN